MKPKTVYRIWCFSSVTLLHAAEGEHILPHKVIFRCLFIVLHHKAHQGQLRGVDGEAQRVIPHRVEPCTKEKLNPISNEFSQISHINNTLFPFSHCLFYLKYASRAPPVPLFSMCLVSCLAWSIGTPWISTLTRGSTMESSLMLTLGSCWPLITLKT